MTGRALRFALATSLGQASAALVTIPLSILASELGADGGEGVATALAVVMVVVGVLEGVITGAAQSFVLRDRVEPSRYIARTAGVRARLDGRRRELVRRGRGPLASPLRARDGARAGPPPRSDRRHARRDRARARSTVARPRGRGARRRLGAGLVVAALSTALASSSQALVEVGLGVLRGGVVGLVAGAIAGPFVASALDPSEG